MLKFGVEPLTEGLAAELTPLLLASHEELGDPKAEFAPFWEAYFEVAKQNQLLIVTVRADWQLVGYFVGVIGPSLQYKHCLVCTLDTMFISAEYRKGTCGSKLLKEVERQLGKLGVDRWLVGSTIRSDISSLFERLKFNKIEVHYSKWLGETKDAKTKAPN